MADHNDIKNILAELLKKTDNQNHQAIALVGDWGIGKTFLWQEFYDNHKTSLNYDKYAYVSLFGVSSLEELKLKIATEIVSTKAGNGLEKDIVPSLKKLGSLFSTASFSDAGVSVGIGSSVVSGLVLSSLKDTLVCLDDLERRGKNLPIEEVIGLVNYLREEKDCSVVCLLNRDEINDEQYDRYKEKVFTYELSIDDSLSLLLEKIVGNFPENSREIIRRFYSIFDIKNIRFYKRVIELYNVFIANLSDKNLTNTSKDTILSSFLLMMAFDMMPKVMGFGLDKFIDDYSEENHTKQYLLGLEKDKPGFTMREREVNDLIQRFISFFKIDKWQLAILEFMNVFRIDADLSRMIEKDLFTENSLANKRELDEIVGEYYNLKLKPNFAYRLAESIKKNLKTENYGNISFWCNVLEGMGKKSEAEEIELLVKQQIDAEIKAYLGENYLENVYPIGKRDTNDKFYDYIQSELDKPAHPTEELIIQFFINIFQNRGQNISSNFLKNMTKDELKSVIWADISKLKYGNRRNFIKSVITCNLLDDKEKVRLWAVEILKEKAKESFPEQKYVINKYLEWTSDLTKVD